jgi:hypothetical protein
MQRNRYTVDDAQEVSVFRVFQAVRRSLNEPSYSTFESCALTRHFYAECMVVQVLIECLRELAHA